MKGNDLKINEIYLYKGKLKDKNIWIKSDLIKTDFVYDYYGHDNVYFKDNTRFFSNYNNEKCILLNIKTKNDAKKMFYLLLKLGDYYPFNAETRTSFFKLCPKKYDLVILSKYNPSDLFSGDDLNKIKRRYSIVNFN